MKAKTGGFVALILGLALIVAALAVKFVILPGQAQWPDDVDSTRTYDGTLHVMLNQSAFDNMDLVNLFSRDVPITISRHVTTEEVNGGKAIVREVAIMHGPDGQEIQGSDDWYAIDRKTMNSISMGEAADFVNSDKVKQREGLVIGFPIGTSKKEYDGWSSEYQSVAKVSYVREEERGGLNTYVFEASSSPKETLDPAMLALFPQAIQKSLLQSLAEILDIPEALREQFGSLLPNMPDVIPLKYTYEYETTYWVEPTTGVLIDYDKHEAYKVALPIPGLPAPVPIIPVFEQSYHTSAASVADAAKDAKDAKRQLDTFGTTIPLALGLAGLVLAATGVLFIRR